ncbi:MAG: SRPBCC family protein [Acidimicrobiia bacterium]
MPGQSFQHSTTTSLEPSRVWASLDEPHTWEAIPGVDRVIDAAVDPDGRLRGFSFESDVGGRKYLGKATPGGREEGRLMAWDIDSSEVKGKVSIELGPNADGTRVQVRLDVEGVGMLGSLFFPVIASAIGSGFAATVEEFVAGL